MTSTLEQIANDIRDESDSDIYFYNGAIMQGADLRFMQLIDKSKKKENALIVLVTTGGDPHAAYKIARYMQTRYDKLTVLVSGECKSAGTLIAVGAHSIAFAPYGELGPIDVQTRKMDNLTERQSGLTITESMQHLTASAIQRHAGTFSAIMKATAALISFKTAAQAASELITGLYAPIFSQIDPMEVGEKARSMRIASDYGKRLDANSKNLKEDALRNLTETYPSHSFVIDMQEAHGLFKNVRSWSPKERDLVETIGLDARLEFVGEDNEPIFMCLSGTMEEGGENEEPTDRTGGARGDREDSPATIEATDEPIQDGGSLRVR